MDKRRAIRFVLLLSLTLTLFFLAFTQSVLGVAQAEACPAFPGLRELRQPDGAIFHARQWGDEWLHGWETADGYTILKDKVSGYWYYARRDEKGSLVSTGVRADRTPPAGVPKHVRPLVASKRGGIPRTPHPLRKRAAPRQFAYSFNVPVILVTFSDTVGQEVYGKEEFEALLFGDHPSVATGPGSLKDYYKEVSYGRLLLSPGPAGVAGWVYANLARAFYGSNNAWGYDLRPAELVREAVLAADAQIDFSQCDSDGDGRVDAVVVIHQGRGEEESGDPNDIWSHQWSLSGAGLPPVQVDGVIVDDYTIQPERLGQGMSTIGVFCHEFGHVLGLPDLYDPDPWYDPDKSSAGVGSWDLMGAGGWLQTQRPGDTPAHFSAWSKTFLGWVTPERVKGFRENAEIRAVEESPQVYMLLNNPQGVDWQVSQPGEGEYFLVENRQRIGFDRALPGEGLLVWHVDESVSGWYGWYPNSDETHKLVDIEEADGLADLDFNRNYGDAGDPFPGTSGARRFSSDTNPDSNWYDGRKTGVTVSRISDPGLTMTADLGTSYAVTHPGYDDVGATLAGLGYNYFELQGEYERLADPDFLDCFSAAFINSAGDIPSPIDGTTADALRFYVANGGKLYLSDWAFPFVNEVFPSYVNFIWPDPCIGAAQTVNATVADSGLRNYLGAGQVEVTYALDNWAVIDSVGTETYVLLEGDVPVYSSQSPPLNHQLTRIPERQTTANLGGQKAAVLKNRPLAVSFPYGNGVVVYTTWSCVAQPLDFQQKFLEYTGLLRQPLLEQAVTVSLPDETTAAPGSAVVVPVYVANGTGAAGFQFVLLWDVPWLTEPQVEKGTLIAEDPGWIIGYRMEDGTLQGQFGGDGFPLNPPKFGEKASVRQATYHWVGVLLYNTEGRALEAAEGELLRVSFKVAQDAPPGTAANVWFEEPKVSDRSGQALPVEVEGGHLTVVPAREKGDVSGDGVVDIFDVVKAINIALGRITPTDEEMYAADVNSDGEVDIFDVVRIINIALGRV